MDRVTLSDGSTVSTLVNLPSGHRPGDPVLVLAHGAGTDMRHAFLETFATSLAREGLAVVRFNFPYTESGKRRPDPPRRLEQCWRDVVAAVRSDPALAPRTVFGGGKSMGGRIASMVAATDPGLFDALVFVGYPLHPPGRPEKLRAAHLAAAAANARMLFLSGTRDDLCRLELLRPVLAPLGDRATLRVVEKADHSFRVPKRVSTDVLHDLVRVTADFFRV